MKKNCEQCGSNMKRIVIKKGSFYKRGIYRYECKCGYTESIFADGLREDAISKGLLDDELGILKPSNENERKLLKEKSSLLTRIFFCEYILKKSR